MGRLRTFEEASELLRGRLEKEGDCWVCTYAQGRDGYVRIRRSGRMQLAHRYLYTEANDAPPPSWDVHHLCFNRPCVHPGHLDALPAAHNAAIQRGKRPCPHPEPERYASNGHCKVCSRARTAKWRADNPGKVKANNAAYYERTRNK